ncbi:MAG: CoA transferase, partial [Burkholderiales bacterium]|nr:CoA transferase [Burkholderiales bacterium]
VSVSLYNSMLAMQMQEAAMILMRDQEVNWAAMPLSGVFECADQPLVLVGAFKANPLRDICTALGLSDLSADPRFCNLDQQFANKAELQRQFRERFRSAPRDHWLARLEEQDLLCAPVRDLRDVLVDAQTVHNGMVMDGGGPAFRFIASPITMSAAPVAVRRPPPRLGEHSSEVLKEAEAAGRAS